MAIYSKIFMYVGLLWGIISLCLLIVAWRLAIRNEVRRHRFIMIFLTAGAWLFIASYLLRYTLPGYTALEVPRHLVPWLAFHGTMGLIPLFGATTLVWARLRADKTSHLNRYHQLYGRILVSIWCFTHMGGILNFFLFT